MLKSTITFTIKKQNNKSGAKRPIKLNVIELTNKETQEQFEEQLENLKQPKGEVEKK